MKERDIVAGLKKNLLVTFAFSSSSPRLDLFPAERDICMR